MEEFSSFSTPPFLSVEEVEEAEDKNRRRPAAVVDESVPRNPPIVERMRQPLRPLNDETEAEGSTGNRCFPCFEMAEVDSRFDFKSSLSSVDFHSPEPDFDTCSLPAVEEMKREVVEKSAGFVGFREPLDVAVGSCSGASTAVPSGINPVELLDPPLTGCEMLMPVDYSNNIRGGQKIKIEELPGGWDAGPLEQVFRQDAAGNLDESLQDGFNWRKYGQKNVKCCEYPRSYYRCNHPGCDVKRKVERSYDGQVKEIVYNGDHCHTMPNPDRLSVVGLPISRNEIGGSEMGCWDATELSNPLAARSQNHQDAGDFQGKIGAILAAIRPEREDRSTRTSLLMSNDGDESELYLKRRTDACAYESRLASRSANEQKVVILVKSAVDILDDGYRWRKYGQKVVKGNPNPRSYYKCSSPGCSVKKHVERAAEDLESVLTSYEGKHIHEVPSSRNSEYGSVYGTNSQIVPNFGIDNVIARTPSSMLKNEQLDSYILPDFQTRFNVHEGNMPTGFIADTRVTSPFFNTILFDPMVQSAIDPYGLNSNHTDNFRQVPSMLNALAEKYPTSYPMELYGSHNLASSSFDNTRGAPVNFGTASLPMELNGSRNLALSGFDKTRGAPIDYGTASLPMELHGSRNIPLSGFDKIHGAPFDHGSESLPMELRGSRNLAVSGFDKIHGAPIDYGSESLPMELHGSRNLALSGFDKIHGAPIDYGSESLPMELHGSRNLALSGFDKIHGAPIDYGSESLPMELHGSRNLALSGFDKIHGAPIDYGSESLPMELHGSRNLALSGFDKIHGAPIDYGSESLPMELHGSRNLALSGFDKIHGAPIDYGSESLPPQLQHGNTDIRFLQHLKQEQSNSAVCDSSFPENHHIGDIPSAVYDQVSGEFAFKE